MKFKYFACVFLIFFYTNALEGQSRFELSALAGLNISQINGDNAMGFDKTGVQAGLRLSTLISKTFDLDIELVYTERGATTGPFKGFYNSPHSFDINLTYAEVPLLLSYKFGLVKKQNRKDKDWYTKRISIGASFSRLIRSEISERRISTLFERDEKVSYVEIADSFKENEIQFILGYTQRLLRNFGFSYKFNYGVSPLYEMQEEISNDRTLNNYSMSFLLFYVF